MPEINKNENVIPKHGFDLEQRTTEFAKQVILLCKKFPKNPINNRLIGQIVGSSGSIGANYREANDCLGKNDFIHRLKISRKESKETLHWFELLEVANPEFSIKIKILYNEGVEIKKILSSIINKFVD